MSDDIIIIVPRGTKVRYAEADVDQLMVTDAAFLEPSPLVFDPLAMFGMPVYEAERYAPSHRDPFLGDMSLFT